MTPGTRAGRGPLYGAPDFCWKSWSVSRKFVPEVYWLFNIIYLSTFCWWLSNHWILLSIFVGLIPNLTAQTLVVHKNHAAYSCETSWNAEKWIWNFEKPCFYWNKVIFLVSEANWNKLTFKPCGVASKFWVAQNSNGWSVDQFPLIDGHWGSLRKLPCRINLNHVKIMPEFHSGLQTSQNFWKRKKKKKKHSEALAMPPEFVQHFPWHTRRFQIPAASETLAMPLTNGRFVKV